VEPILELKIESRDEEELSAIEEALSGEGGVQFERVEPARVVEPVTLIALAGAALGVVDGVLALADRLKSQKNPPIIVIRNAAGDELSVERATRDQLEHMVENAQE